MATLGQYNLDNMTARQVIDACEKHLLTQNKKSERVDDLYGDMSCVYKGEGGVCCAAGIFIQNYDNDMEEVSWDALTAQFGQTSKHEDLVLQLQHLHDQYQPYEWKHEISKVRQDFGLNKEVL